jgi:hypothetical protein
VICVSGAGQWFRLGSEERESRALRLIGGTFFALAACLAVESVTDLVSRHWPEQSTAGIVAPRRRWW